MSNSTLRLLAALLIGGLEACGFEIGDPFSFTWYEESPLALGVREDELEIRMPVRWFRVSELDFLILLSPPAPMRVPVG